MAMNSGLIWNSAYYDVWRTDIPSWTEVDGVPRGWGQGQGVEARPGGWGCGQGVEARPGGWGRGPSRGRGSESRLTELLRVAFILEVSLGGWGVSIIVYLRPLVSYIYFFFSLQKFPFIVFIEINIKQFDWLHALYVAQLFFCVRFFGKVCLF